MPTYIFSPWFIKLLKDWRIDPLSLLTRLSMFTVTGVSASSTVIRAMSGWPTMKCNSVMAHWLLENTLN